MTPEEVSVRVDRHLVLALPEVLDGIAHPRVALEARHYELFGEAMRGISSEHSRLHLSIELLNCFFDQFSNNLLNVLDVRDLGSFVGAKILGVLIITLGDQIWRASVCSWCGGSHGRSGDRGARNTSTS